MFHFAPFLLWLLFFHGRLAHVVFPETENSQFSLFDWKDPFSWDTLRQLESLARKMKRFGLNETCPAIPPFPCLPFNDEDGVSEHTRNSTQVRFKDVHYIAALGDSITAGFGMISAKAPETRLLEYRGHVFSIGTGPDTLPWYMEKVAQHPLLGASTLSTLPLTPGEFLNRAVTGAHARDLRLQVLALLELPPRPWKLLTIFIGGNDVCQFCQTQTDYLRHLQWTLETLYRHSSHWVVNVVGLFKVSQAHDVAQSDPYCYESVPHQILCPCLNTAERRQEMDALCNEYNHHLQSLSEMYHFPYFKVNYQPALVNASVVPYNQTYISKLDCFHPNLCLNRVFAYALWNNMLEPQGKKSTMLDPARLVWKCPSKDNMYLQ